ncbi:MAG: HAD family phosphatase [Bacteroidetes bacterium CHB5]|nr:HAD family phosphatase [Bacteroidetes bacterium CHB5]
MQTLNTGIKNIIFDLGGVILNLSVERTHQAFADLSGLTLSEIKARVHQGPFFHDYERGLITDAEFRHHVRETLQVNVSDLALDTAWNAMLLDIPTARLALLEQLKQTHRVFLLSNTNEIHRQCFNNIVRQTSGKPGIEHYFHRAYFSHLLNLSKPDVTIYQQVVTDQNLLPHETVFLDDNADNIAGAAKAGLHTFHVQHPNQIFDFFA